MGRGDKNLRRCAKSQESKYQAGLLAGHTHRNWWMAQYIRVGQAHSCLFPSPANLANSKFSSGQWLTDSLHYESNWSISRKAPALLAPRACLVLPPLARSPAAPPMFLIFGGLAPQSSLQSLPVSEVRVHAKGPFILGFDLHTAPSVLSCLTRLLDGEARSKNSR